MAEEGEKKEAESKKHTYPLVRVRSVKCSIMTAPVPT